LKMVNIEKKIMEAEKMNQHPEFEIDQNGFKRFKGLLFISRKVEQELPWDYKESIIREFIKDVGNSNTSETHRLDAKNGMKHQ
jgi:hypothetical protein